MAWWNEPRRTWRGKPKRDDEPLLRDTVRAIRSGTEAEAKKKLSELLDVVYNRAADEGVHRVNLARPRDDYMP